MQDFKIESLGATPKLELPAYSPTLKIFIAVVILLLLGVSAYFLFGRNTFAERNITLQVDYPSEISSGDRATYKVHYKNGNRSVITNAKLSFFYPTDAIVLKDGNVVSAISDTVDIGTIGGNEGGGERGERSFEFWK